MCQLKKYSPQTCKENRLSSVGWGPPALPGLLRISSKKPQNTMEYPTYLPLIRAARNAKRIVCSRGEAELDDLKSFIANRVYGTSQIPQQPLLARLEIASFPVMKAYACCPQLLSPRATTFSPLNKITAIISRHLELFIICLFVCMFVVVVVFT